MDETARRDSMIGTRSRLLARFGMEMLQQRSYLSNMKPSFHGVEPKSIL